MRISPRKIKKDKDREGERGREEATWKVAELIPYITFSLLTAVHTRPRRRLVIFADRSDLALVTADAVTKKASLAAWSKASHKQVTL